MYSNNFKNEFNEKTFFLHPTISSIVIHQTPNVRGVLLRLTLKGQDLSPK